MIKSPITKLLAATCFQFYVSIVDPSILAQPTTPGDAATVSTVSAPANPAAPATGQSSSGDLTGLAGALQQGATGTTQPAQ